MQPSSAEGRKTIAEVKRILRQYPVSVEIRERNKAEKKCCWKADLVITIGGDGTFLRAAQFNERAMMFAVNQDPRQKVGFFTRASRKDFARKFRKIMEGKYTIIKSTRLETSINGKNIELALNEIFFGDKRPYKMCRYLLNIQGRKEKQRSSGLIIATGSGSHAWFQSAGGKSFPITSRKFAFVVREPYEGKERYAIKRGIIGKKGYLKITSLDDNNMVVVDALSRPYAVPKGTTATIKIAKKPLYLVSV